MSRTKEPPIKQGVISDCCQAPVLEENKCKQCRQICTPITPETVSDIDDEDDDWDD